MFARVTCPACQFKFSIPEGDMGRRHVCPNCQSPFFAGSSVPEPVAAAAPQAAPKPGYAKTMLGETAPPAPPIKYNCPRCQAPLEAPANEAGTKKPCPACGQRLQVPAPPPLAPEAAQPNLNKTMLASDELRALPPLKYNCPNCKKPLESPASEAGAKKNCPACGQRFQIPAAPTGTPRLNKTILATDESKAPWPGAPAGIPGPAAGAPAAATVPSGQFMIGSMALSMRHVAIGAGVLLLLLIVVPALFRGGQREDPIARAKYEKELEDLRAKIDERKAEIDRQKLVDADIRRRLEDMAAKIKAGDEKMDDDHREALRSITDVKLKRELEDKFAADKRKRERENRDQEKNAQKLLEDAKARLDESTRKLEEARQRRETIIQQPPPYIYYHPPYHPRYYWPW